MIIYKITNTVNNKIYIGQTTKTADQRLAKHWSEAKCASRPNNYFHNAMLKYGIENFTIEVIDHADSIEELNIKEAEWIERLNSTDKSIGYNLMTGGKSGTKSDETKDKLRARKLINWKDEELAERMKIGLRKGNEVWRKNCEESRVELVCPVCGKSVFLPPWEAKKRTYCSTKCASEDLRFRGTAKLASDKAAELKRSQTKIRNAQLIQDVHEWLIMNKDIVMTCPKNKIATVLAGLQKLLQVKYEIIDWRSIGTAICGTSSKKELLNFLKSECENICCAGLN